MKALNNSENKPWANFLIAWAPILEILETHIFLAGYSKTQNLKIEKNNKNGSINLKWAT